MSTNPVQGKLFAATKTFTTRVPIEPKKNTPQPSATYVHQRTPVGKR